MVRRRRRRRHSSMAALVVCAAIASALALRWLWLWIQAHQTTAITAGVGAAIVVVAALWLTWWRAHRRRAVRYAQSMEVERYGCMGDKEFEYALATLCERDGCRSVRVVGGSGDLGADVIATSPSGLRIVLQAKRYAYSTRLGSPDVQRFGGTCFAVHDADLAVIVTTSGRVTKAARAYAEHVGIHIIDSQGLSEWASRTGRPPWETDRHQVCSPRSFR